MNITSEVEEYDLIMGKIGFGIHICSECNGTREITGHKHWCSRGKKYRERNHE